MSLETELLDALDREDLDEAERLLSLGANPFYHSEAQPKGITPLHMLAMVNLKSPRQEGQFDDGQMSDQRIDQIIRILDLISKNPGFSEAINDLGIINDGRSPLVLVCTYFRDANEDHAKKLISAWIEKGAELKTQHTPLWGRFNTVIPWNKLSELLKPIDLFEKLNATELSDGSNILAGIGNDLSQSSSGHYISQFSWAYNKLDEKLRSEYLITAQSKSPIHSLLGSLPNRNKTEEGKKEFFEIFNFLITLNPGNLTVKDAGGKTVIDRLKTRDNFLGRQFGNWFDELLKDLHSPTVTSSPRLK